MDCCLASRRLNGMKNEFIVEDLGEQAEEVFDKIIEANPNLSIKSAFVAGAFFGASKATKLIATIAEREFFTRYPTDKWLK